VFMFVRTESFREFIKSYPMISIILMIHLIIFIFTSVPYLDDLEWFEYLAGNNEMILAGEYWRLITPIFVHLGFSHILFNSFSLIIFAPALERTLGSFTFIIVYLVAGIAANIATLLIQPAYFTHVSASGAIFGLFGIYLAFVFFKKGLIHSNDQQIINPIAVVSVIMTFLQPNINITGHIFGLISGILIGKILVDTKFRKRI